MSSRGANASASNSTTWCTIESDPGNSITLSFNHFLGVFTELIATMGAKQVQVEEIYELNQSALEALQYFIFMHHKN